MVSQKKDRSKCGFTLIELMVVIAITALILAVLISGLAIAKERARRVVCLANIHQFTLGIQVYAEDNRYHLPNLGMETTFNLLMTAYDQLSESTGHDEAMFCPSLGEPFIRKSSGSTGGFNFGNDRHYIGYNYLGGHNGTPWPLVAPATKEWTAFLESSDTPTKPIVTELNAWSPTYNKTVAPHGKRGPIRLSGDYMNTGLGGISSKQIGVAGGNIGFLDGSGKWKHINKTDIYVISRNPERGWFSAW